MFQLKRNVVMFSLLALLAGYILFEKEIQNFFESISQDSKEIPVDDENFEPNNHSGRKLLSYKYENKVLGLPSEMKSANLRQQTSYIQEKATESFAHSRFGATRTKILRRRKREISKNDKFSWNINLNISKQGNTIKVPTDDKLENVVQSNSKKDGYLDLAVFVKGGGSDESYKDLNHAWDSVGSLIPKLYGKDVNELDEKDKEISMSIATDTSPITNLDQTTQSSRGREGKFILGFFNFGGSSEKPFEGSGEAIQSFGTEMSNQISTESRMDLNTTDLLSFDPTTESPLVTNSKDFQKLETKESDLVEITTPATDSFTPEENTNLNTSSSMFTEVELSTTLFTESHFPDENVDSNFNSSSFIETTEAFSTIPVTKSLILESTSLDLNLNTPTKLEDTFGRSGRLSTELTPIETDVFFTSAELKESCDRILSTMQKSARSIDDFSDLGSGDFNVQRNDINTTDQKPSSEMPNNATERPQQRFEFFVNLLNRITGGLFQRQPEKPSTKPSLVPSTDISLNDESDEVSDLSRNQTAGRSSDLNEESSNIEFDNVSSSLINSLTLSDCENYLKRIQREAHLSEPNLLDVINRLLSPEQFVSSFTELHDEQGFRNVKDELDPTKSTFEDFLTSSPISTVKLETNFKNTQLQSTDATLKDLTNELSLLKLQLTTKSQDELLEKASGRNKLSTVQSNISDIEASFQIGALNQSDIHGLLLENKENSISTVETVTTVDEPIAALTNEAISDDQQSVGSKDISTETIPDDGLSIDSNKIFTETILKSHLSTDSHQISNEFMQKESLENSTKDEVRVLGVLQDVFESRDREMTESAFSNTTKEGRRFFGGLLNIFGSGDRELPDSSTQTNLSEEQNFRSGFVEFGSGENELNEAFTISERETSTNSTIEGRFFETLFGFGNGVSQMPEATDDSSLNQETGFDKEASTFESTKIKPQSQEHTSASALDVGSGDSQEFPESFGSGEGQELLEMATSLESLDCANCSFDSRINETSLLYDCESVNNTIPCFIKTVPSDANLLNDSISDISVLDNPVHLDNGTEFSKLDQDYSRSSIIDESKTDFFQIKTVSSTEIDFEDKGLISEGLKFFEATVSPMEPSGIECNESLSVVMEPLSLKLSGSEEATTVSQKETRLLQTLLGGSGAGGIFGNENGEISLVQEMPSTFFPHIPPSSRRRGRLDDSLPMENAEHILEKSDNFVESHTNFDNTKSTTEKINHILEEINITEPRDTSNSSETEKAQHIQSNEFNFEDTRNISLQKVTQKEEKWKGSVEQNNSTIDFRSRFDSFNDTTFQDTSETDSVSDVTFDRTEYYEYFDLNEELENTTGLFDMTLTRTIDASTVNILTSTSATHKKTIESSERFCNSAGECNIALNERCISIDGRGVCSCGRSFVRHPETRTCEASVMLKTSLKLPSEAFHQDLSDKSSELYQQKRLEAMETMRILVSADPSLLTILTDIEVLGFEEGSLIVHWELVFAAKRNENISKIINQVDADMKGGLKDQALYKRTPLNAENAEVLSVSYLYPCEKKEFNYCSKDADCIRDEWRGYKCNCKEGFLDNSRDMMYPGEICIASCPPNYCGDNGFCELMGNGGKYCLCDGWHFGGRCEFPGVVIIGAFAGVNVLLIVIVLSILCILKRRRTRRARFYGTNQVGFQPDEDLGQFSGVSPRIAGVVALDDMKPAKTSKYMAVSTPRNPEIKVTSPSVMGSSISYDDSTFDRTASSDRSEINTENPIYDNVLNPV